MLEIINEMYARKGTVKRPRLTEFSINVSVTEYQMEFHISQFI